MTHPRSPTARWKIHCLRTNSEKGQARLFNPVREKTAEKQENSVKLHLHVIEKFLLWNVKVHTTAHHWVLSCPHFRNRIIQDPLTYAKYSLEEEETEYNLGAKTSTRVFLCS
jgi:hypothetical protein